MALFGKTEPPKPDMEQSIVKTLYTAEFVLPFSGKFVSLRRPQAWDVMIANTFKDAWFAYALASRCCLIDSEQPTMKQLFELDYQDWALIHAWLNKTVYKEKKV